MGKNLTPEQKTQRTEYNKRYRLEHKEEIKIKWETYYKNNKKKIFQKRKEKRLADPEKVKIQNAKEYQQGKRKHKNDLVWQRKKKEYNKQYREKNDKYLKKQKKIYLIENAEQDYLRKKNYRIKNKMAALKMYGEVCTCCREDKILLLTIDHINNDGALQRKQNPNSRNLYIWLKKNNYPHGFQTLCWNCNSGKFLNGGNCPHKEYKPKEVKTINDRCVRKCKDEVFNKYGGYNCACCGETNKLLLNIDHINNDGKEHRDKQKTGYRLCIWIRKNNYPPIFQILCWNCNIGRSRNNGICPHKMASSTTLVDDAILSS